MVITKSSKSDSIEAEKKCCYDSAQSYIYSAIQELSKIAPNDKDAKDSIVNLSVVLFDLKSIEG